MELTTGSTSSGDAPGTRRQTLTDTLSGGALPAARALGYAVQIARELRDLHAAGAMHGRVTAANIQIGPTGASITLAQPAQGQDAYSDVRGWGAVLYEMLTGASIPTEGPPSLPVPEGPRTGPDSVLPASKRLALKCLGVPAGEPLTMHQAFSEARMLALLARQYHLEESTAHKAKHREEPAAPGDRRPVPPDNAAKPSPGRRRIPCPRCQGCTVVGSHPHSLVERCLASWGRLWRCVDCGYRWVLIGRVRVRMARRSRHRKPRT